MAGKNVLVVEDEGLIALHLTELLEKSGYRVSGPVSSGEMCLRVLSESPADLVLMDIALSGKLDGIETAKEIRERYHIPVIFLTAYTSDRMLDRIRDLEPGGYLTKPVAERDLFSAINAALGA